MTQPPCYFREPEGGQVRPSPGLSQEGQVCSRPRLGGGRSACSGACPRSRGSGRALRPSSRDHRLCQGGGPAPQRLGPWCRRLVGQLSAEAERATEVGGVGVSQGLTAGTPAPAPRPVPQSGPHTPCWHLPTHKAAGGADPLTPMESRPQEAGLGGAHHQSHALHTAGTQSVSVAHSSPPLPPRPLRRPPP